MKADPQHEGNSFARLLKNPTAEWPHLARTSFGPGNYAICSEQFRYIHLNDGTEEFYDHVNDPHEWKNIINSPNVAEQIKKHRSALPKTRHAILGKRSTGHQAFEASEAAAKK